MNAIKTTTEVFKIQTTKNNKEMLKVFNEKLFDVIPFIIDSELSACIQVSDYAQLTFVYLINYNGGRAWGNLLSITDPEGGVLYNALSV